MSLVCLTVFDILLLDSILILYYKAVYLPCAFDIAGCLYAILIKVLFEVLTALFSNLSGLWLYLVWAIYSQIVILNNDQSRL